MSPDDIRAALKDELGRIAPEIEFDSIPPGALLREEIDIDSMDFLNLVTALHQRLKVDIPETDYPQLATIQGALSYLSAKTA